MVEESKEITSMSGPNSTKYEPAVSSRYGHKKRTSNVIPQFFFLGIKGSWIEALCTATRVPLTI
jgi:hypothetical protein